MKNTITKFEGETWSDWDKYMESKSPKLLLKIYNALLRVKAMGEQTMRQDFYIQAIESYFKYNLKREIMVE